MSEEVDCEFCLQEEEVPPVGGEGGVNAGEDRNEMGFECSDRAFGGVVAVHVGWDQLVGAVPHVSDVPSIVGAGFVVENNGVNRKILSL